MDTEPYCIDLEVTAGLKGKCGFFLGEVKAQ